MSLARLCRLFDITRQSYYQHYRSLEDSELEHQLVIKQVNHIRSVHPKIGVRKLHFMLRPFMEEHHIKMGRDALFNLMAHHGLLIRNRKRKIHTTHSNHWMRKYPNLIREWAPREPNQLWVSDITYWKIVTGFVYISLITDAYSRKIVGYHLSDTLETRAPMAALQMALDSLIDPVEGLIHHSDRGIQYCSYSYVNLLKDYQVKISMTENGDPLENPIAERINGIIKQEYLLNNTIFTLNEASESLRKAVRAYNEERPHASISYLQPSLVHQTNRVISRQWKNYYRSRCVKPK
jgi:putative transposase